MKLKVFSIRDSKIEAFMQPFFAQTTAAGIRIWADSVNGDTGFAKHPLDYCLFELGEFDQEKGSLTAHTQPVNLGFADDHLPKTQQPRIAQAN